MTAASLSSVGYLIAVVIHQLIALRRTVNIQYNVIFTMYVDSITLRSHLHQCDSLYNVKCSKHETCPLFGIYTLPCSKLRERASLLRYMYITCLVPLRDQEHFISARLNQQSA